MTTIQNFLPLPGLRSIIRYYTSFETGADSTFPVVHEVVPRNLPGLYFISDGYFLKYRETAENQRTMPPCSIMGPVTRRNEHQHVSEGSGVLVNFTPYGLFKLFGTDMQPLQNKAKDAGSFIDPVLLWHTWQMIFGTELTTERIKIIECFLFQCAYKKTYDLRNIDKVADHIDLRKGNVSIDCLCKESNMSVKTFERHFHQKIGLSPKLYAEICRFSHAYHMLLKGYGISRIINLCGYTDQAHMIREFKRFTGSTPKKYNQRKMRSGNFSREEVLKNDEILQYF